MGFTKKQVMMIAVLMGGAMLVVLNQTVISPALPVIMHDLSIDASTAQWLTSGFALVSAIVIPITAYLMDRFTTRKLYLASFGFFLVGSLLTAWGPNFAVLLFGRLLQAVCAGMLMPMVMTILMLVFPREKRGFAMGIYNLVICFAPAVGPVVSGVLTDTVGWHVLFLIMAGLAVVIIILASLVLKNFGETKEAHLDKPSVLLSSAGLLCLLYGFSTFGGGASIPLAIALIALGVIILGLFARRQFKLDEPMLQLRVLGNKQFSIGVSVMMIVQGVLAANAILTPIYMQTVRGFSPTESGLVIVPGAILGAVAGLMAGRLFDRFGARPVAIAGSLIMLAGGTGMATLSMDSSFLFITTSSALLMAGLMLANTPLNTWALNALSDSLIAHGNAVSSTLRQVAGSLGTALMVSIMALTATFYPGETAVASSLTGIHTAFILGACIIAVSVLIILFKVKNPQTKMQAPSITVVEPRELDAVMKPDAFSVPSTATLQQVIEELVERKTSGVPIVDEAEKVVGFISDGDIMKYLGKLNSHIVDATFVIEQLPDLEDFQAKVGDLVDKNVMSIATPRVISVDRAMPLDEVCRVLAERRIKKVPVLDAGRLVGTVSRGDVMRHLMTQLAGYGHA